MIVWIAAGVGALGLLWAINRINVLASKPESEVRNFVRSGDWLMYERAVAELRRRGLDITPEAPLIAELLTHESAARREVGWKVITRYYPDVAEKLVGYNPGADRETRERIVRELLPDDLRVTFRLDYDRSIHLDAENLAEQGIGKAYRTVLPTLRPYVTLGTPLEEVTDIISDDFSRYVVRAGNREHVVYSSDIDDSAGQSWGRAAVALFTIVNDQLQGSTHRFYAIGGGNDLSGMFLTPSEAELSRRVLTDKTDWPYLPVLEDPWYGQHHG